MLRTMLDSDITLHTLFDMEPVTKSSSDVKDRISKKVIGELRKDTNEDISAT